MRLSDEAPIGFALVAADGRNSGAAAADLEPCSETPRKLTLAPEDEGELLAPALGGGVGDGDVGGGEAEAGAMGVVGVTRESGGLDVKPGGETGCVGVTTAAPADGATVPDGCHAGGNDDADDAGG